MLKSGVNGDAREIAQHRRMGFVEIENFVGGARLRAMRGGEDEIARDRGAGAEGASRTNDHHHGARRIVGDQRRATDQRVSGAGEQ